MDCFGTYFTHVQTRNVTRVQSAAEWMGWGMFCVYFLCTHVLDWAWSAGAATSECIAAVSMKLGTRNWYGAGTWMQCPFRMWDCFLAWPWELGFSFNGMIQVFIVEYVKILTTINLESYLYLYIYIKIPSVRPAWPWDPVHVMYLYFIVACLPTSIHIEISLRFFETSILARSIRI